MHHILILHSASKYKRKLIKKTSEETLITSVAWLCVCVSIRCVCVKYGWHPVVACFDTYSRPKQTVCLPPTPQVLPSPCPA